MASMNIPFLKGFLVYSKGIIVEIGVCYDCNRRTRHLSFLLGGVVDRAGVSRVKNLLLPIPRKDNIDVTLWDLPSAVAVPVNPAEHRPKTAASSAKTGASQVSPARHDTRVASLLLRVDHPLHPDPTNSFASCPVDQHSVFESRCTQISPGPSIQNFLQAHPGGPTDPSTRVRNIPHHPCNVRLKEATCTPNRHAAISPQKPPKLRTSTSKPRFASTSRTRKTRATILFKQELK